MSDNGIRVSKWDGSLEDYDPDKIRRTIVRIGASNDVANKILKRIEDKLYDKIPTSEILDMVFEFLKDYRPSVSFMKDLRTALTEIKSKPVLKNTS